MLQKALILVLAGLVSLAGQAADSGRSYVVPPKTGAVAAPPFSSGVMVGDTFYVAGHIGTDPSTGQAPADAESEARLVMDGIKHTLEQAGLKTEDLVSVTVYCTDIDLFDKFNAVYRSYFHGNYPARAFIGINKLLRSAHFEVAGVAIKPPGPGKR